MMNGRRAGDVTRWVVAAAASLVILGCESGAKQAPQPAPRPAVTVVTLRPTRVSLTTELPGRVSGYRIAEVLVSC